MVQQSAEECCRAPQVARKKGLSDGSNRMMGETRRWRKNKSNNKW